MIEDCKEVVNRIIFLFGQKFPQKKSKKNPFLKCREATTSFPYPVICHFEALRIFPQEHVECFCFILQKFVAYTVFGLRNEYFRWKINILFRKFLEKTLMQRKTVELTSGYTTFLGSVIGCCISYWPTLNSKVRWRLGKTQNLLNIIVIFWSV